MVNYDLLIKGGTLIDPASDRIGSFDIAVDNGHVISVEPDLSPDRAREVCYASGKLVLPGLIDTHVHLTPVRRAVGFKMLARAGVTCALDCSGLIGEALEGMACEGSGISVAVLNRVVPGDTVSGPEADGKELDGYLDQSLADGAFGLKLLGGHNPLSPDTTIKAIELSNRKDCYVAFHCGSTRNGSNLEGLLDALEFAGDNRLQICHVNAYCRGFTHGSPVEESMIALRELAARPHLVSESHMAPFNSCGARLSDDVPCSHVTRACLKAGGFEPSRKGLLSAAETGYLKVYKITNHDVGFAEPEEGPSLLEETGFEVMVSFQVNRRSTAFLMASEKDDNERFIVTALSTDGGGIPRNFLLSHGLSLVRFGALTLSEFVLKCCWYPARMLGLPDKGHLGVGADGDVTVVDPETQEAELTVAGGRVIMSNGIVFGAGGTIITTERGRKTLSEKGVPNVVANLEDSLFYTSS